MERPATCTRFRSKPYIDDCDCAWCRASGFTEGYEEPKPMKELLIMCHPRTIGPDAVENLRRRWAELSVGTKYEGAEVLVLEEGAKMYSLSAPFEPRELTASVDVLRANGIEGVADWLQSIGEGE